MGYDIILLATENAERLRRGIGRGLVEALIREAEDRECVFVWLGTDTDNKAAQACFNSVPDVEEPQTFLSYEWGLEE